MWHLNDPTHYYWNFPHKVTMVMITSPFFVPFSLSPICLCLVTAAIEFLVSTLCCRPLAPSCCYLQLEEQPDSWKKSSVLWHENFPCKSWVDTFAPAGQQLIQMKYFLCKNCWCSVISSVFSSVQKSLYWGVLTVQFPNESCLKIVFPLLVFLC